MAIYHCSIKIIGRSNGKSAVSSSAYRSGKKLVDKETGIIHDYTRKSGEFIRKYPSVKMHRRHIRIGKLYGMLFIKWRKKVTLNWHEKLKWLYQSNFMRNCRKEVLRKYVQQFVDEGMCRLGNP